MVTVFVVIELGGQKKLQFYNIFQLKLKTGNNFLYIESIYDKVKQPFSKTFNNIISNKKISINNYDYCFYKLF